MIAKRAERLERIGKQQRNDPTAMTYMVVEEPITPPTGLPSKDAGKNISVTTTVSTQSEPRDSVNETQIESPQSS